MSLRTLALRLSSVFCSLRSCCLLPAALVGVVLVPQAQAYTGPIDNGPLQDAEPALGIGGSFGRWNTRVRLVYDPDHVPALYGDNTRMLSLINAAAAQWEQVSGIDFEIVGVDAAALDDGNLGTGQRDGLVRIYWTDTNGFAGLAGPDLGDYDQNLGYFPYYDGEVKLNNVASDWHNEMEIVSTLAHEFGHLIGLGHSENPVSIMYANPYNNLNYPRTDDIQAAQALYGVGSGGVDANAGVSAWRYAVPVAAPSTATQFLFKANERLGSGPAFLSLQSNEDAEVTSIGNGTADAQFVYLNSGGIGGFTNNTAIDIHATVVLVDPDGYVWDRSSWDLACPARSACGGGWVTFATTTILKSYPGVWKYYVVDEAAHTLLLTKTLTVSTTQTINQAPVATFTARAGATDASITLTIAATDAEKNNITVIWHLPGTPVDRDGDHRPDAEFSEPLGADGVAEQTIDFSVIDTYALFVELKDDGPRYGTSSAESNAAGDGFSNVLRFDINLPLSGIDGGVKLAAQHPAMASSGPTTTTSTQTLKAVAGTQVFSSTSTSGTSTAAFNIGASKDSGATISTSFKPGDSIIVAGSVLPQVTDLNKAADIYVVVHAFMGGNESWLYRDSTGAFRPWTRFVVDLKPFMTTTSLQSGTLLEVYKGSVGSGTFNVFLGYKLTGSNVLHYTPVPMQFNVN